MRFPILIFIVIPFVEIVILLKVGQTIGALPTIALVVLTAFVGINLLKRQGLNTLLRFQDRLRAGQLPAQEIVEGMLVAFAGALLLAPGFITDTLGVLLLTPAVRRRIARRVLSSGNVFMTGGSFTSGTGFGYGDPFARRPGQRGDVADGEIIDGEFRNETDPLSGLPDDTEKK
jgi:UPF0716 protein FxsA